MRRRPGVALRPGGRRDGLEDAFLEALRALLTGRPARVLAAVSGGPDSMALWDLLERWRAESGARLFVGHVNHGLRGRAADRDAAFVQRRARSLGTPCAVVKVDAGLWARRRGKGVEEAARFLRYRALARLARRWRCPAVLTAHTLDDPAETVFLRLLRGTGPSGLAGMAPDAPWPAPPGPRLLRPLLAVRRARLLTHLRANRLPSRRDETNLDPAFLRNRVRPFLRSWDRLQPGFFERLGRLADVQRGEEASWDARLRRAARGALRRKRGVPLLERAAFKRYDIGLQRRLIRRFLGVADFEAVERLRRLAGSSGTHSQPARGGRLEVTRRFLSFRRART